MSAVSYKCPNCDGPLTLDPATGLLQCDYCGSSFTEEQVDAPDGQQDSWQEPEDPGAPEPNAEQQAYSQQAQVYSCPSCGAQIITDATTAATTCVFCHNPVVLSQQVSGELAPDHIIPFAVTDEAAANIFQRWCKSKLFLDPKFVHQAKKARFTGIYYPYWIVDALFSSDVQAQGRKQRVWRQGNTEYTEHSTYQVQRSGRVHFWDFLIPALTDEETILVQLVYPYDFSARKPFSMGFLSGFFARRRTRDDQVAMDIARTQLTPEAQRQIVQGITGVGAVSVQSHQEQVLSSRTDYTLVPAWVMSVDYRGKNYRCLINGQTGQIAGDLPVSNGRLWGLFGGIFAGVLILLLIARWLA